MNTIHFGKTLLAAAAFAVGASAGAATMTRADYGATKDRISADYKADSASCDSFSGNAKDICVQQAKGRESIARAQLEANYSGKADDVAKVEVVKADANYAVAKEMCDDKAGNAKDVCVAEAKATHTKQLADAKLQKTVGAARNDAMADKRDADYKVAAEKCEVLAGDAKNACVGDAKARFNKN